MSIHQFGALIELISTFPCASGARETGSPPKTGIFRGTSRRRSDSEPELSTMDKDRASTAPSRAIALGGASRLTRKKPLSPNSIPTFPPSYCEYIVETLRILCKNHATSEPHTHVMSNENKFPLKKEEVKSEQVNNFVGCDVPHDPSTCSA